MTDIYNVTNVFTRAEAILDRLKDDDPAAYARFTEGAEHAEYVKTCHRWAMDAEAAEEQARFCHNRLWEYTVVIEQNTETLANAADTLFDFEKSRLSEQLREATQALEDMSEDLLTFSIAQVLIIITGQAMIDGDAELRRALLIAGLRPESGGDARALFEAASEGGAPLRLEAKESGYHPGMKPDGTWDARMLMD